MLNLSVSGQGWFYDLFLLGTRHLVSSPDHVPSFRHTRTSDPRILKPSSQENDTRAPCKYVVPSFIPFCGGESHPQDTTAHTHITGNSVKKNAQSLVIITGYIPRIPIHSPGFKSCMRETWLWKDSLVANPIASLRPIKISNLQNTKGLIGKRAADVKVSNFWGFIFLKTNVLIFKCAVRQPKMSEAKKTCFSHTCRTQSPLLCISPMSDWPTNHLDSLGQKTLGQNRRHACQRGNMFPKDP